MASDKLRALSEAAITNFARPKSDDNPSGSRIVDVLVDVVHFAREFTSLAVVALAIVRADMTRDTTNILAIDRLARFEPCNVAQRVQLFTAQCAGMVVAAVRILTF